MAITYQQKASSNNGNAADTTLVLTHGFTISSGDLLVYVHGSGGTSSHTQPTGFTQQENVSFNTSGNTGRISIGYKFATGSEGSTFTFTNGSSTESCVVMARFTGADSAATVLSNAATDTTNSSTADSPSVTTAANNSLVLMAFEANNAGVRSMSSGPLTSIELNIENTAGPNADDAAVGFAYTVQASAGPSGTGTWTSSGGRYWGLGTMAFEPDTGGATANPKGPVSGIALYGPLHRVVS